MTAMNRTQAALILAVVAALFVAQWRLAASERSTTGVNTATKSQARKKDKKGKKPLLAKFMRAKLSASNQVLEGLCTEDFELIEKGAKSLHTMSKAEQWRVSNDAMYRQYSLEYRRGVEQLENAAKAKKLDSAALAWTKTTLNCIECHRWVKANLIADR